MKTDVCMILEGSYPYVVGGVSTWVHDILTSLKDVSFSLVHIGVSKEATEELKYEFPPNVLEPTATTCLVEVTARSLSSCWEAPPGPESRANTSRTPWGV